MLVPHHVVHHLLLHGQVPVRHVLSLAQLFRGQVGIVASRATPSARATHHRMWVKCGPAFEAAWLTASVRVAQATSTWIAPG